MPDDQTTSAAPASAAPATAAPAAPTLEVPSGGDTSLVPTGIPSNGQVETINSASTTMTVPETTPIDTTINSREAFDKFVPADMRDKEWVKNIAKSDDPQRELFKKVENLNMVLQRRSENGLQPPAKDAPEEEKRKFYRALGVPESVDEYKIQPTQWAPENKELGEFIAATRPPELMRSMAITAQRIGVTPEQLQELHNTLDENFLIYNQDLIKKEREAEAQQAADFDNKAYQYWGDKANAVLQRGNEIINAFLPPELRTEVNRLDNNALLVLAAVSNQIYSRMGREDSSFKTPNVAGGQTRQDIEQEGMRMMQSEEYMNVTHPGHEAMRAKVDAHYRKLKHLK